MTAMQRPEGDLSCGLHELQQGNPHGAFISLSGLPEARASLMIRRMRALASAASYISGSKAPGCLYMTRGLVFRMIFSLSRSAAYNLFTNARTNYLLQVAALFSVFTSFYCIKH